MLASYPAHRIALLNHAPPDHILVHEIYASLQGESTYAGFPCVFVRTTVCGQRCTWCDTPHAFNQGTWLPQSEILERVRDYRIPLVEFTGGEPLLQVGVLSLIKTLCDEGYTVLLETGGAEDVSQVDPRACIIMDLKCPDSGEAERNRFENLSFLKSSDQIKFVIASRRDWEWTLSQIQQHQLDERFVVLLSAVFGKIPLSDLAKWILAEAPSRKVRMQLQMHKFIWDPNARGV